MLIDYMAKSDEVNIGIKALEHKERGFNLSILISGLPYSVAKVIPEDALFLSGRAKEAIFSESGTWQKKLLTISNKARSLARKELKIRSEGGEKQVGR